jgi:hypothetical protein
MYRRSIAMVAAVFALTTAGAFAQTIEATPIPKPAKPNFAPFAFMVGTWSCSTQSARRPAPYLTTTTYSMDPSGYWMIGKSMTKPTTWSPGGAGVDQITYDPDTGRWVDVFYGDLGFYDMNVSKGGWKGSKFVWHDIAVAPGKDVASQSDLTWTKVSNTKMTGTSSFTTAKGRTVGVTSTCTKRGVTAMHH